MKMFDFAKKALLVSLFAGVAVPAFAADYIEPPIEVPVVVGGWYIRGHIGMSNQYSNEITSSLYLEPSILDYGWHDGGSYSSAPIFGAGVGY